MNFFEYRVVKVNRAINHPWRVERRFRLFGSWRVAQTYPGFASCWRSPEWADDYSCIYGFEYETSAIDALKKYLKMESRKEKYLVIKPVEIR
jgi:hypothetical protein